MIILQQSRGCLSSGDQLSLDLPFAKTKSLTPTVGPTPNFTRASAGTFIGSDGLIQTATAGTPRFDHDPVTRVCRGLLLEDTRTNRLLQSETLETQSVTINYRTTYTLSFYGTGTVVFSGAISATVVGIGAYPSLTTYTFIKHFPPLGQPVPTLPPLTLTVTGSVQFANFETGDFATSWIPTTTTPLTRSADVCSIRETDFNGMWNATEGTLYASFYLYRSPMLGGIVTAGRAGTQAGRIEIGRVGTTRGTFNITDDANVNVTHLNTTVLSFVKHKAALAYRQNDVCGIFNTSAPFLSTAATLGTQNELIIGNLNAINRPNNAPIDSIRVYRKRLPLAKLQGLTKP